MKIEGNDKTERPQAARPSLVKRLLFSLLIFLALLVVLDRIIVLIGWPAWARHEGANNGDGVLLCYSSDPDDSFPLDLAESAADLARARPFFKDKAVLKRFVRDTPHCVSCEEFPRRQGAHPERPRKLALVGGSFTAAYGLELRYSLGPLLEQKLPQFNVNNYGYVGTNTEDVLGVVGDIMGSDVGLRGPHVGTEGVLYFYNLNDLEGADHPWANGLSWNATDEWWNHNGPSHLSPIFRISGLFRAYLIYKSRRLESDETVSNLKRAYLAPENRLHVERTMGRIKQMMELTRARGVGFLVVIYPMLHQDLAGRYPFGAIHKLLLNKCKEAGVKCVDGLPAFGGQDMVDLHVHRADAHPNKLAARLMVDYLIKGGHLPVSSKGP